MKQTAVEQLGIAFRQWQKDWDNFDKTRKNQPVSYDEFIIPFLEMEKQQIIDALFTGYNLDKADLDYLETGYYNETYGK